MHLPLTLSLATLLLCSSCAHTPISPSAQRESVFPRFTLFPAQQNLPRPIIDDLPRRIAALPAGQSLSISRLVKLLGLSAYRNNVSQNLRWNTSFMYLDADHILYFLMDTDTLPKDILLHTPWNAKVIECSLLRNPDVTITTRKLVKQ